MASLRKTIPVAADPDTAWAAVKDFGALHTRLVPGFVTACTVPEEGVREIVFANRAQVRERLVGVDDALRRLAYTTEGGRASHYNAAVEVLAGEGRGSVVVWTVDVLPDAIGSAIGGMMALGVEAMRRALGQG